MMQRLYVDQMGESVSIPKTPQRIISLVPSITELLFDLGLADRIIACTNFCIHPASSIKNKTKIGGTKTLDIELIHTLQPDLIIGNKEENVFSAIQDLKNHYPVWMSDINSLEEAYNAIQSIGTITDTQPEANYLVHLARNGFNDLKSLSNQYKSASVCYLIWKSPFMAAGTHTFIDAMLKQVGFNNAITSERYPELTIEHLKSLNCDYLFLASEPYPFSEKHRQELQDLIPHTQIVLVDGEMFSWYGSRMVKAVGYFFDLQKALFS